SDADPFVADHVRTAILTFHRSDDLPALWSAAQQAPAPGRRAVAAAIASVPSDAAREMVLQLSADSDPGVRGLAAGAIARLDPAGRAHLVMRGLDSHESRVRIRAALLAARDHLADCLPALASVVARVDELDEVRRTCKRALWEMRDALDPATLLVELHNGASDEDRLRACVDLGIRGADGAVQALGAALQSEDPRMRAAAAQALAALGNPEAAAVIREAAAREPQIGVRVRLEKLARDAGAEPDWHSIALGN